MTLNILLYFTSKSLTNTGTYTQSKSMKTPVGTTGVLKIIIKLVQSVPDLVPDLREIKM